MLKKNPVTFEGVVAAQSIRARLQAWCQIHDVRNETECKAQADADAKADAEEKRALAQADLATDDTATGAEVAVAPDGSDSDAQRM